MKIVSGYEQARRLLSREVSAGDYSVTPALRKRLSEMFGTQDPEQVVRQIIAEVRRRGDAALFDYSLKIDGVNVWNTLIDKGDTPHARASLLYWNGWARLEAIRVGQWKLFLSEVKEVADSDRGPVLIHLANDPAERTNLAQDHPEKVKAMRRLAESLVTDIEANSIPLGGPPSSRRR